MKIGITYFENEYYALVKYMNEHGKEKVALRKVHGDAYEEVIRHDGRDILVHKEIDAFHGGKMRNE